jgi:hypothetical protein
MDVTCTINAAGNLVLSVNEEERQELAYARDRWDERVIFSGLLESYACNGSFTYFDAGEGNPFVGLTSAPCIAEAMDVADDGTKSIEGRFWAFMDYMVTDPLEVLQEAGEVVFTLVD